MLPAAVDQPAFGSVHPVVRSIRLGDGQPERQFALDCHALAQELQRDIGPAADQFVQSRVALGGRFAGAIKNPFRRRPVFRGRVSPSAVNLHMARAGLGKG